MDITYKEYKNGNITIKASDIDNTSFDNAICEIANNIDWIDTYLISDYPYNLGNYCIAVDFYNVRLDTIYTVNSYQIYNIFLAGKTLRLYARIPDEYDREIINQWYNED